MSGSLILVSSWEDGVFIVDGDRVAHELAGRSVASLTRDRDGRALAIVDGARVCRREAPGGWSSIVEVEAPLACCVVSGGALIWAPARRRCCASTSAARSSR